MNQPLSQLPSSGACHNCAFLGVRMTHSDPSYVRPPMVFEVTTDQRTAAYFGSYLDGGRPHCAMHKVDLAADYFHGMTHSDRELKAKALMCADRRCGGWKRYREGLSPKEEREEQLALAQEEDRRSFLAALESQKAATDAQRDASNAKTEKLERSLTIAGLILAAIALGSITPDSLLWEFFGNVRALFR